MRLQALKLWLVVAFLGGCAALSPPERPECAPELLARLSAAEVAEVLLACEGVSELECAEARNAIRVRYSAKRDAWVHCGEVSP
jgi:hypothetical protein